MTLPEQVVAVIKEKRSGLLIVITRKTILNGLILWVVLILTGCITVNGQDRSPVNTETLFLLAAKADKAYVESRWLDAARDYQRLADMVPEDYYAWFRLGNTYAQQGSFNQAISAYQSSIKRNPNQPKPWYNLATAHLLNAQDALKKSYTQLRSEDPARGLIEKQLNSLSSIIYQRVEDVRPPEEGLSRF